jgi:hypothetical protein
MATRPSATARLALEQRHSEVRELLFLRLQVVGFDTQRSSDGNGPGPYLIENNHLEGPPVDTIMFGGADPKIGTCPVNITLPPQPVHEAYRVEDAILGAHQPARAQERARL